MTDGLNTRPAPADQSVGELVKAMSEQTSRLVRDELKLATAELQEKGKRAGVGAGMFGGAGLLAFFGAGALITCAIAALGEAMPVWAAALIVAAVLFAGAGLLALIGRKNVTEAVPPTPERAIAGAREDVATVKERIR